MTVSVYHLDVPDPIDRFRPGVALPVFVLMPHMEVVVFVIEATTRHEDGGAVYREGWPP